MGTAICESTRPITFTFLDRHEPPFQRSQSASGKRVARQIERPLSTCSRDASAVWRTPGGRASSRPISSASWWSRICSARIGRWKMSSTGLATPTSASLRSTTAGASPVTWSNGSPLENFVYGGYCATRTYTLAGFLPKRSNSCLLTFSVSPWARLASYIRGVPSMGFGWLKSLPIG